MSRYYHRPNRDGRRHNSYGGRATVSGGCMFCQNLDEACSGHTRKQCPLFKQLKKNTATRPYIEVQLQLRESEGYAAAGLLLWRRTKDDQIEILLAREYRPPSRDTGGDKLNFLGGKRLQRETDALTCAVDKINQETGGKLSAATLSQMRDRCPLVCWSSSSKYVLFVFELVGEDDYEIDVRCVGIQGAKRLEWVTRQDLVSPTWAGEEMHPYAIEMLELLTACQIMKHLEELFDMAYNTPTRIAPSSPPEEGHSDAQVAEHFDIVDALRSSLEAARPDYSRTFTSATPSYIQLRNAAQELPKRDRRKLWLRFHPDRLRKVLGRPPSKEEPTMATRAMQIINGLFDPTATPENSEKDIITGLEILSQQRQRLVVTSESPSRGGGNMKQVQDLLFGLSLKSP